MVRILILTICFAFQVSFISAADFLNISLKEALRNAATEKKYVLLYLSAKWCGPCKHMDKSVFPNDTVTNELNNSYIALEIDGESWVGERIVKEFGTQVYPTFLVLNSDREVINRAEGYMNVAKFMDFLSITPDPRFRGPLSQKSSELEILQLERPIKKLGLEFGVKLGFCNASISNLNDRPGIGFDLGGFVSIEKGRFLVRPGFEYN